MKKLKKSTTYQPPKVTIVFFKVEEGFASILSNSISATSVDFGGETNGLMNHSTGDHSGLGAYSDGGNIFGQTAGN